MMIETVHYTVLGIQCQPAGITDCNGYLKYRTNFQASVHPDYWTSAERYIDNREREIDVWRESNA